MVTATTAIAAFVIGALAVATLVMVYFALAPSMTEDVDRADPETEPTSETTETTESSGTTG